LLHKNHARNEAAADAKKVEDEKLAAEETADIPSSEENDHHHGCETHGPENFNKLKKMADNIRNVENDDIDNDEAKVIAKLKEDAHQLVHMGAATALAIAIHNFPEGLPLFYFRHEFL
jgi:zinc transporter ZupT